MVDDYKKIVERVSASSGLNESEIREKVEAKKKKLSGLISKEGAAQIVAAELGISLNEEKIKILEIKEGMRRVNVVGKITRIFPVRDFNKNGREGKVASFYLGDETSNVRVALWDSHHIDLVEKGDLKEDVVVDIMNANVKNGELHLSNFSDIKKSKEKIEGVKETFQYLSGNLENAKEGERMSVRAVVVQSFEPRFFESKRNPGEKGVLLNIVLDDGTETIRAVLFDESIKKVLAVEGEELFLIEKLNEEREKLLGEEKIFSGVFRMNSFTGNLEMSLNGVEEVDVDKLVEIFEKGR